jgi:dolichyl-phosphate beta-glucosyltransferase
MKHKLSIIIPAYEESDRLGDSLNQILAYIVQENLDAELIVVDDGSKDNTTEVAKNACAKFQSVPTNVIRYDKNRGKGYAVKVGLLESNGEIGLFSDADLSTPIDELSKLIKPIEEGKFDVTFGSRALDRSLIGTHQSWRREQGGKVFNFIVRFITKLPYWDTQCGFKAFRMSKFRPLLDVMQIDRFGFDVEFLYVAKLANLRLEEIAVRWNHCDGTKVSVFRDSQRMFREVGEIKRNDKNGVYDNIKGERGKI